MNITVLVMCIVLILYLGGCVLQWRRLVRDEEKAVGSKETPQHPL